MNSYNYLKIINDGLEEIYYDKEKVNAKLVSHVPDLHKSISEDFNKLFGYNLNLEGYHLYHLEPTYRQNSIGIILNEALYDNEDVKVRFECIIEHSRIWVKLKNVPRKFKSKYMLKQFKKHTNNSEEHAEFREL